jgi:hypothetical protein
MSTQFEAHHEKMSSLAQEGIREMNTYLPTEVAPDGYKEALAVVDTAAREGLAAAAKYQQELQELAAAKDRGTIPQKGIDTLTAESLERAQKAQRDAAGKVEASLKVAEALMTHALTPRIKNESAELLARETYNLVVGDSTGKDYANRLRGMVINKHADERVIALVGSPYFVSHAYSRNVPDVEELAAELQRLAALKAGERIGACEKTKVQAQALHSLSGGVKTLSAIQSAFRVGFAGI